VIHAPAMCLYFMTILFWFMFSLYYAFPRINTIKTLNFSTDFDIIWKWSRTKNCANSFTRLTDV